MADKNTIKNWFLTGLKPTQAQFWATWDSFWHKDEKIPITAIDDIENILLEKADAEVVDYHLTDEVAHADLFNAKEDKNKKGVAGGYAPLNEFTKLAIEYLNVVNDLVTGGVDSLLTGEQGKLLQTQIDNINVLLTSDNVNLDNVQEIVDAIETVQMSLSSILVNDLTTGGTTKALTAEMGVQLKALIDNLATVSRTGSYNDLVDKPVIPPIPGLQQVIEAGNAYNNIRFYPSDENYSAYLDVSASSLEFSYSGSNMTGYNLSNLSGFSIGLTINGISKSAQLSTNGLVLLTNINNTITRLKNDLATDGGEKILQLPNQVGVLAISVNGITAGSDGNIVLPIPSPPSLPTVKTYRGILQSDGGITPSFYTRTLESDFDDFIIWTRNSIGVFYGKLDGAFDYTTHFIGSGRHNNPAGFKFNTSVKILDGEDNYTLILESIDITTNTLSDEGFEFHMTVKVNIPSGLPS